MIRTESMRIALRGILHNKLRSLLTMLGMLIGVGSVIMLVAVGTGSSQKIQKQIEGLGTNIPDVDYTYIGLGGTIDVKVTDRTRVAAFGWASNGAGTVNDVAALCALCRDAGAISYVDAVHFAPHGPIDVAAVGCDFLVCSAYKFFGPHVGILYGRAELLERHRPYKVRPAPPEPPHSWETGTVNLEGIAGTAAAVAYLRSLGMDAVAAYERGLAARLLEGLTSLAGVTVYGTTDLDRRVPTAAFNVAGRAPAEVSAALGERGIFVWDGNYYALELMQRLGLEDSGGAVRVGAAHYNTATEIDSFLEAVAALC